MPMTSRSGKQGRKRSSATASFVASPYSGTRPAGVPNFLLREGAVLWRLYGEATKEAVALERLRPCFPDREVIGIDCRALMQQYVSLHCVTMQIPS